MKREFDLEKFISLRDIYLKQRYSDPKDYEILARWDKGESVVMLSQLYHRSPSSIYRLRERAISFLEDPGLHIETDDIYARLLTELYVEIPTPLLTCAIDCTDTDVFLLFRLSIGLYTAGQDFLPRWFLAKISSSLGRKRYAMKVMDGMSALRGRMDFLFSYSVYQTLTYDHGIKFKFSKIVEGVIDSYPVDLLVTPFTSSPE